MKSIEISIFEDSAPGSETWWTAMLKVDGELYAQSNFDTLADALPHAVDRIAELDHGIEIQCGNCGLFLDAANVKVQKGGGK